MTKGKNTMGSTIRARAALALGGVCLALAAAAPPSHAASGFVLAPDDGTYVKECGACHMPFSPELLPAASWKKVMASLDNHFGETASLDAPVRERITGYLTAHAADRSSNDESRAIMDSLRGAEAPVRITKVPYIAGLHAAVLDPTWMPKPHPKTLSECAACHRQATSGNYKSHDFSVSDELFRAK